MGIGLLGCGVVGSGVARLLLEKSDRLASRAGRPLVLRRVAVRDLHKERPVELPRSMVTIDPIAVIRDPDIQVVVELIGGVTDARQYVLEALTAGKHVVTANKALLAQHGAEVFECARKHERTVAFEASVAGGVPIIAAVSQSLAANQITSIQGILNGTSNFILTAMAEQGQCYEDALREAQKLGYAEADPTLDVDGGDAAHKLAILAQIAFGIAVPFAAITRRGITDLHAMDLRFADELGYTIKLLAEAWLDGKQVALHVEPVLLRKTDMLAQVRGAFNAIQVVGDVVGETLYQGPGAGMMPTASAVVADLIDLAVGRAQRTFQSLKLWSATNTGFTMQSPMEVRSRFYLRLLVEDRPGVLADICKAVAKEEISISSVIQHEALDEQEGEVVPLVIMTHSAPTGNFLKALRHIDAQKSISAPAVYYAIAD